MKLLEKPFYQKKVRDQFAPYPKTIDKNKPLYLFGAATVGKIFIEKCKEKDLEITAIFDNKTSLWGKTIEGILIQSPEKIASLPNNSQILIASIIYEEEILQQLSVYSHIKIFPFSYLAWKYRELFDLRDYRERFNAVFKEKQSVQNASSLWADKESQHVFEHIINFRLQYYFHADVGAIQSKDDQYFEKEVIALTNKEIFVDGGGYSGDTVMKFLEKTQQWSEIYTFEPDSGMFPIAERYVHSLKNPTVQAIKKGLYKHDGTVSFYALSNSESGISEEHSFTSFSGEFDNSAKDYLTTIDVTSLDTFFQHKTPPTFIKMDIEGAEKEALQGASQLLRKYKPKLAICVYHKPSDLWEIPLLIQSLNPTYKLYLRHYTKEVCETVCYAI